MPSAFTIEGNRRVCRRHGKFVKCKPDRLGSAASEHREHAKTYERLFAETAAEIRGNLAQKDCAHAFVNLLEAVELKKGFGVHAFSFRQGRQKRESAVHGMQRDITALARQFAHSCMRYSDAVLI
jgi:hypothetical protein